MNWIPILTKIATTPCGYRYWVTADYAQNILRCSRADLEALFTAFNDAFGSAPDGYDVWNIGLYSGSRRTRPEIEMAHSRRIILGEGDWVTPIRHEVDFEAVCPRGALCDSDAWSQPDVPGAVWCAFELGRRRAHWMTRIEQRGAASTVVSGLIAEAWHASLERYRYQYTCPELAVVVAETQRRRVGDCTALSVMFATELRGRGVQANVRSGFFWGGMAGRVHQWVEAADCDGQWKVLDLSMAILARDFSIGTYGGFCFGSRSNRVIPVAGSGRPSVSHPCGGTTLQVELGIRRPPSGRSFTGPQARPT